MQVVWLRHGNIRRPSQTSFEKVRIDGEIINYDDDVVEDDDPLPIYTLDPRARAKLEKEREEKCLEWCACLLAKYQRELNWNSIIMNF